MLKTAMKEKDGVTFHFVFEMENGHSKFPESFSLATLAKSVLEKRSGCDSGISVAPFLSSISVGFFVYFHNIAYTMFSASFNKTDENPLSFLDNFLESVVDSNFKRILDSDIVDYEVSLGYDDDDNNPEVKRNWK